MIDPPPKPRRKRRKAKPKSDGLKRAARTLFQVGTVSAVVALLQEFHLIEWTTQQTVAVITAATPIVSFLQNWLEDNTPTPKMLK